MQKTLQGVAPLGHLGVIRAQGEDAAKFLHNQFTNDFALLGPSGARLAAYCSPKGRMLASVIGFKLTPNDLLLVCSRDLLATTLKRLSMFVMRAKVVLSDASADFDLYGLAGTVATDAFKSIASESMETWAKVDFEQQHVVKLPPAHNVPRALWVAPAGSPAPAGEALAEASWAWGEVASAVVLVTQPLSEALVPQMLNYESVGGVNFKKGCYPGQEVVARSQFRGTLKRRAYLAHAEAEMQPGAELFSADDASQPCGVVVQAALSPMGGCDAMVSIQVAAFELGQVHLGAADGPAVSVSAAPYPLLADI